MKKENEPIICVPIYKEIVFYTSYVFSFISLIGMVFVLKELLSKERKRTMLSSFLLAIAIAEVINCINKLSNIITLFYKIDFGKHSWFFIYVLFQIILTIFSDLCTLFASLMMSYIIYESTRKAHTFLEKKLTIKILLILTYVIPLSLGILYSLLDYFLFYSSEGDTFYSEECKIWNWMNRWLSISFYLIVIITIVFIIYFTCKTIGFLKRKKAEFKIKEEDSIPVGEEEAITNENIINDEFEFTKRINGVIQKIVYFPIVTIIIWTIFIFDRVPDDISLIALGYDNNWFSKGFWLIFKRTTILLHNFVSTIRGVIYCLTFFRADRQLFKDFKTLTAYVFCFKCCKKDNDIEEKDEEYRSMTIGMEDITKNQDLSKIEG